MRMVCLDQSLSNCGYGVWNTGDELPKSGAWQLAQPGKRAQGFIAIHREISNLHAEAPIDVLACELPLKLPTDTVGKLIGTYGLLAHIESICTVKRITFMMIDQRDWRSTFYDGMKVSGRENWKRVAVERCRQFGMDPVTDDEAEALGLLDHVMHMHRITPPWRLSNPLLSAVA